MQRYHRQSQFEKAAAECGAPLLEEAWPSQIFLPLFTPARLLVESGGLWREAARSPVKAATNCEIKTNQKLHPTGHNDGTYAFALQTLSSPLPTAHCRQKKLMEYVQALRLQQII